MIAIKLKPLTGATILDPCAGKGEAIKRISAQAKFVDNRVFACELDQDRSVALAENVHNAFCSMDYLSSLTGGSVSCAYVNPPFDDEIGGGGRVETKFVYKAIGEVQADGVVVIVVPEHVWLRLDFQTLVQNSLYQVEWFKFPESDRKFNEVVIFGYKKAKSFQESSYRPSEQLRSFRNLSIYHIPKAVDDGVFYRKWSYTEQELSEIVLTTEAASLLEAKKLSKFVDARPPMPIRSAHVAMLLASGLMNGLVEAGPDTHVVRGQARKVKHTTEELGEGNKTVRTVETERISLSIKTIDLGGNIRTLTDKLKDETEVTDEEEVANDEVVD